MILKKKVLQVHKGEKQNPAQVHRSKKKNSRAYSGLETATLKKTSRKMFHYLLRVFLFWP